MLSSRRFTFQPSSPIAFGREMSATTSLPTYWVPLGSTSPTLGKAKLTVTPARTAIPRGNPVSGHSPEGMSTAITGKVASLRASITWRWIPVTSDVSPMPKMASTHTLGLRERSSSLRATTSCASRMTVMGRPILMTMFRLIRARSLISEVRPRRWMLTS